jgi:hypothetical protein
LIESKLLTVALSDDDRRLFEENARTIAEEERRLGGSFGVYPTVFVG